MITNNLLAQSPIFSQFFNSKYFNNPGFIGDREALDLQSCVRIQRANSVAQYVNFIAQGQYYFSNFNSGVGLQILSDRSIANSLSSTSVISSYSYKIDLNSKTYFRLGLQLGFIYRNTSSRQLTFYDQINGTSFTNTTAELLSSIPDRIDPEFGTGAVFKANQFMIAIGALHLNSFLGKNDLQKLPPRFSLMTQYDFILFKWGNREESFQSSISPVFHFQIQSPYYATDWGAIYQYSHFKAGVLARGIPVIQTYFDAVIFYLGFDNGKTNLGYSFDYTISPLSIKTGGSHEITLGYVFEKSEKDKRRLKMQNINGIYPKRRK